MIVTIIRQMLSSIATGKGSGYILLSWWERPLANPERYSVSGLKNEQIIGTSILHLYVYVLLFSNTTL